MKIAVIDDKKEELEKAKRAVEEKGYQCLTILAGVSPISSWIEEIEGVDAVITDLHFNPQKEGYPIPYYEIPAGLLVVIHALAHDKPVVICTDAREADGHHSETLSWLFDAYVSNYWYTDKASFGWEERKDWSVAVQIITGGKKIAKKQ